MAHILDLIIQYGTAFVFLWVLCQQAGIPLPSYPVLLIAGSLAAAGKLSWPLLLLASTSACLIADYGWYLAGGNHGSRILRLFCKLSLTPDRCISQTESIFDRWGALSLVFAKFIPGFGSVATVMAGVSNLTTKKFLLYDIIGAMLWSGLGLGLGWLFASAVDSMLDTLNEIGRWGLALIATAIAAYIAKKMWARRNFRVGSTLRGISVNEFSYLHLTDPSLVVIDVRTPIIWNIENIPRSVIYASEDWSNAAKNPHQKASIVVYCDCPAEASAVIVAHALVRNGFTNVRPLIGGIDAWRRAGFTMASN